MSLSVNRLLQGVLQTTWFGGVAYSPTNPRLLAANPCLSTEGCGSWPSLRKRRPGSLLCDIMESVCFGWVIFEPFIELLGRVLTALHNDQAKAFLLFIQSSGDSKCIFCTEIHSF